MVRKIQRYGWKPDLPDHRDFKFSAVLRTPTVILPERVDLRHTMPPIQDQGQLGSCTAHASVALLEHNMILIGRPLTPLSRLFLYYNSRAMEGGVNTDSGAMLRDVISSLADTGICPESDWPYNEGQFTAKPPDEAYTHAALSKISLYARLTTLQDMQMCLATGHPFVFGFTVYSSFESQQTASTGVAYLPGSGESIVGGHAVCAVGYEKTSDGLRFIVRNSWGVGWGQGGYFTMPADYLTNEDLATDFWTVRI